MPQSDEERIESIKKSLYSRENAPEVKPDERTPLTEHKPSVSGDWREEIRKQAKEPSVKEARKRSGLAKKLLWAAGTFLVVALAVSAYLFFGGLNFISADNVNVFVRGPVSVGSGEELSFDVAITNNNNTRLQDVVMVVEYPAGTRRIGDLENEFSRESRELSDINPSETIRTNFKASLFGERESKKNIRILIEYRLPDSNGVFAKEVGYEIIIDAEPLSLVVDRPADVYSNQEISFKLNIESNSNTTLKNIIVQADYPFGFTFDSSIPSTSFNNNIWLIEELEPREIVEIELVGRLQGSQNEERTFTFKTGTQSASQEDAIAAIFASQSESITIREPVVGLDLLFRRSATDAVGKMGQPIDAQVVWKNNSSENVRNVEIVLGISGSSLNEAETKVQNGGFYQSNLDKITWNKNTTPELNELSPGEEGSLSFSFMTVEPGPFVLANTRNPKIDFSLEARGTREDSSNFFSRITQVFRIISDIQFGAETLYGSGPLATSGPYPPRVEQKTIYNIHWILNNSYNSLRNGEARATLPAYVEWVGATAPAGENISFNSSTREVVWTLGDVRAGVGFSSSSREVYFQVALTPSANQEGDDPVILEESSFGAFDVFTNTPVNDSRRELTTDVQGLESGKVKQ